MIRVQRLDHFGVDVTDLNRAERLGKSHHAFEVAWDDLDRALALFRTHDIPHHAPIDWGDHLCCYFLDPDGNLLELVGYQPPRP